MKPNSSEIMILMRHYGNELSKAHSQFAIDGDADRLSDCSLDAMMALHCDMASRIGELSVELGDRRKSVLLRIRSVA